MKPENILRFRDRTRVGILKIADMGLAKHHAVATYLRPRTSTRYGTVRYEPPEVMTHKLAEEGRSRLYDIWSMGCITLELIGKNNRGSNLLPTLACS
jgi:serine/threonine protein kinase